MTNKKEISPPPVLSLQSGAYRRAMSAFAEHWDPRRRALRVWEKAVFGRRGGRQASQGYKKKALQ